MIAPLTLEQKLRAHCHDLGRVFIRIYGAECYMYDKGPLTDLVDYVPEKLR